MSGLFRRKIFILLIIIFAFHLFFRLYDLEGRAQFTWDQVDNAWNAKNIIIHNEYPLIGMPVKQSTGMFIGPLYYYLVAVFYYFTDLDPIASPIIAGLTSVLTFVVLFIVTKKIFNEWVALISVFIYTFSFYIMQMDRVQWPVNFMTSFSILIFYLLFKIISGDYKKTPLLAIILGLSFHIHFTSLFFFIFTLLSLPLFPKRIIAFKYYLLSIPLLLVWFAPTFLHYIYSTSQSKSLVDFYTENSHGFHLRRFIQVAEIAFLQFQLIFRVDYLPFLKYLLIPIFIIVYLKNKMDINKLKISYLIILWFLVPWFVFSLFRGDITHYYFELTKPIVIFISAYLIFKVIKFNKNYIYGIFVAYLLFFMVQNTTSFSEFKSESLSDIKSKTLEKINKGEGNEFLYGSGESYLYYFYERKLYGKE